MSTSSYWEAVEGMKRIAAEMQSIAHGAEVLSDDDVRKLEVLEQQFERHDAERKSAERQALIDRVNVTDGKPAVIERGHSPRDLDSDPFGEPASAQPSKRRFGNPWSIVGDTWSQRYAGPGELRSRALDAVEKMAGANDATRQRATEIVEQWDDADASLSRQILATSSPAYLRAFSEIARNPSAPILSDEEIGAVRATRAMSLTDSEGGYLVPFQLDPTVINTTAGTVNEIRRAARSVVATGDVWNGVSAGATSWSWDAEGSEVSDDASTFVQPSISVHTGRGFVPISLEAAMDGANVAGEVGRLLAAGKSNLEATALATGSGSGEPFGIVTALSGVAGSVVDVTTTDTFGLEDVYKLDEQLPSRHRAGASWLGHRTFYNDTRQFDTSGGAALWVQLAADIPATLLGKPAYEASAMANTITGSADNYILIFGDFDNYVIADRVGMTVEFIPHLFHTTTNRPSGQRGWYAYYRVGADSVDDGAFRLLNAT